MMQPTKSTKPRPQYRPLSRWVLATIALLLVTNMIAFAAFARAELVQSASDPFARMAAVWRVGIADAGENPALTPNYPDQPVPF